MDKVAMLAALSTAILAAQTLTYRQMLERAPVKADQRIPYGSDPLQFGDLWLPKGEGPHPVVVLIHGGCWQAELPGVELTHFMAADLRDHGFAVWEIEYRRIGHKGGGYPGTFLDVAAGADFLREIATKQRLNLEKVIASGHSAGGHLALWLAARPRIPEGSLLRASTAPLPIHTVVSLAGVGDLAYFARAGAHACGDKTVGQLVEDASKAASFGDTSPSELLPIGVKQIMIHGVYDGIVPPAIGLRQKVQAKAKGEAVEVIPVADAGHFEVIAPWTEPWKTVLGAFRTALPVR